MKSIFKTMEILMIGLTMAIVVYPFLHECGHSLIAWLSGADVIEFNLFPIPNMLCNMASANPWQKALIGAGGVLLPIFLSVVIRPKIFPLWYANFVTKLISALAVGISIVVVILYQIGRPLADEDMTTILRFCRTDGCRCCSPAW